MRVELWRGSKERRLPDLDRGRLETTRTDLLLDQMLHHDLVPCQVLELPDLGRGDRIILVELTLDRKSTRLNSSHVAISYAVFCLKTKKHIDNIAQDACATVKD